LGSRGARFNVPHAPREPERRSAAKFKALSGADQEIRIMELKKAPPPVSDINVTPMVDVMLVVLIIFMVITPLLNKGVNIDLARARNPITMQDADKEDAVIVSITRDGSVFLSPGLKKQPDDLADLGKEVKDLLADRPVKIVYIKADQAAKYSKVEDVVDGLRTGGVEDVGLITEQDLNYIPPSKKKSGQSGT
jgi:biopolymer transport protein ExbD/biopolymer transport protein TolR